MSDYTKYLRLMKPAGNEYYNIENFNHNAELIDRETEKLNSAVTEIKEGATREKAGIVQFGTEEGKALEGMMLARLAGAYGYGGDIQDVGVKNPNYIYYDRNTRKMYKCLKQNSDVAAGVENFIPIDNNSLLDRLENLFTTEGVIKMANGYGIAIKTKISSFKNYIDFNDIFKSINFALVTPWNDFQNEEAIPIFQEIQQDKVLIKGYFPKANIYRKYSTITNQETCPCICLAYGNLK